MNTKKKARELVQKMYEVHSNSVSEITMFFSKQCALIAQNRVIEVLTELNMYEHVPEHVFKEEQEVKQEIEKL